LLFIASYISHHLFPHFTERLSANLAHWHQIKAAPPAPLTQGTLFEPMYSGKRIGDGVRIRMKREKREAAKKHSLNRK
jgi:hypothetical protein